MRLIKGEDIFSEQGEKLGTLDRVIVDPTSKEVTHLVVSKGLLFTTTKVIGIDLFDPDAEKITLRSSKQKLDEFQDFEETHYVALDDSEYPMAEAQTAQASYWYPPVNTTGWRADLPSGNFPSMPGAGYIRKTTQNIPEGTVALEEGARVISVDGNHVGNIEQVIVDSKSNRVTHFVVSEGLLFHERKLVPVLWIAGIDEDEVRLSVGSGLLDRLPEYKLETK